MLILLMCSKGTYKIICPLVCSETTAEKRYPDSDRRRIIARRKLKLSDPVMLQDAAAALDPAKSAPG